MNWKSYTVGFLINQTGSKVMLIKKAKPEWQRGLFNGIGGFIEQGETPHEAMIREFLEETGIEITDWIEFCTGYITQHQGSCICHYFIALAECSFTPRQDAVEQAEWIDIASIRQYPIVPNILWLIAMGTIKLVKPAWEEHATFITH